MESDILQDTLDHILNKVFDEELGELSPISFSFVGFAVDGCSASDTFIYVDYSDNTEFGDVKMINLGYKYNPAGYSEMIIKRLTESY